MQKVRSDTLAVVAGLKPAGRLDPSYQLRLAISLPLRNQKALAALLGQLQDPASPNYHKYLTPAQFAERFGPSESDYTALIAFAKGRGLNITAKHPNRLILDVEGTVSTVEKALHVTMRTYQHPREARHFYAADAAPALDIQVPILGISGLDNYELPQPRVRVRAVLGRPPSPAIAAAPVAAAPETGSGPSGTYMGNDFRSAYAAGVTLTGSGQAIGLLQFDGYTPSDITYYESAAGLPNVTLTNVLLDGFSGAPTGTGGEVEVSLDIEMSISMAPGISNVILYEGGPAGNWHDILNRMASDDLAKQLSCSWYIPAGPADPVADQIFQEMAAQGQTFYSASGDSDAYTGLIPFPGDSPYITQVGGTTLTVSGTGGPWSSETVWNWGNGTGSSGGASTQYPIPAWQQGINMTANLGSPSQRNTPDVSMVGDNVYVRVDGENQSVGGTSCAAPLWAAFTALINQEAASNGIAAAGFINPAVYTICSGTGYAAAFHDTTSGNNFSSSSPARFPAEPGYDLCTGWGTPNGNGLIYALAGPPTPYVTTGSPLANGAVGVAYSQTLLANGGDAPYAWSISAGNLPAGLSLGTNTGVISGTAGASGTAAFTVQVTDNHGMSSTTQFNLTIYPVGTPIIQTGSPIATGTLGFPYSTAFTAGGGATPYAWSVVSGSLPGLTLSSSGLLTGTPSAAGVFNFNVQVTGSDGLSSISPFILNVPPPPTINSSLSETGTNEAPFNYQITATNQPSSYGASGLPPGLSVNTATGLISGTTSATGTSNVTLYAGNIGGTGSAAMSIVVVQMPAPVIVPPFATLISFNIANGEYPVPGLSQGSDGNLYGTTFGGGTGGYGTVFKMTPGGSLTTLDSFDFIDGYAPLGGVIQASNGNLYGITEGGGTYNDGEIYEVGTSGSISGLFTFNYGNGGLPADPLVQGMDGNLYGTARYGGAGGYGTVFVMTPGGALTTLQSFTYANGYSPTGGLAQGSDGNFYGTTELGGNIGDGIVFKITPAGSLSTLFNFNGTDGMEPVAGLVQGSDGNFYGTTYSGGTYNNGTVFAMTSSGTLTTLMSFTGNNGAAPVGGLIEGFDGNYYGTTYSGGSDNDGTVFMMTPAGTITTLYSFSGPDGANSQGSLIQAGNGTLYGTTTSGGAAGYGTVFSLVPFNVEATLGMPFSYQITAVSNSPPSPYSATDLPAGLNLNPATGLISGTPTTLGTSSVAISATNPGGTGSVVLSIAVVSGTPVITSALSVTGTSGQSFSYRITASKLPASYQASAVPAGLALNTATGVISGTATAAGVMPVTVGAINASGTGTAIVMMTFQASFAAWQSTWFLTPQLANAGPLATPAGDGILNLLKYALNLNPLVTGVSGLPAESALRINGSHYLSMTYTSNMFATDITYIPEVSTDLATWNSGPGYVGTYSAIPNADGATETVRVYDLAPMGSAPEFIRLRVTQP